MIYNHDFIDSEGIKSEELNFLDEESRTREYFQDRWNEKEIE